MMVVDICFFILSILLQTHMIIHSYSYLYIYILFLSIYVSLCLRCDGWLPHQKQKQKKKWRPAAMQINVSYGVIYIYIMEECLYWFHWF